MSTSEEKAQTNQSVPKSMSNSSPLPEDVLRDIFSRLHVQHLARFKLVCKSWLTLLSDPNFITSHHNSSISIPQNHYTIIRIEKRISFFNVKTFEKLKRIKPIEGSLVGNLVGTCNGLVCLRSFGGKEMFLWNPLIRKYKRIDIDTRSGNAKKGGKISFSFGFGLDVDGFNFVCLRIVSGKWGDELIADVQAYSSLSNSWKSLDGEFRFNVLDYTNCVIVKGVPYWTAIVRNEAKDEDEEEDDGIDVFKKVVIAFDVAKGEFRELEYPEFTCQGGLRDCFVEFEGCLGVIMRRAIEAFNQCVEVWVLDEEEGCWVKKLTVGSINVDIAGLVGFTIDRNVLGVDGDANLFVFDSETKEVKQVYCDVGNSWYNDIQPYTESLVSVAGMIDVGAEEQVNDN